MVSISELRFLLLRESIGRDDLAANFMSFNLRIEILVIERWKDQQSASLLQEFQSQN